MGLAKPLCCRFIISQWRLPAVVLARGPTRRRLVRCPALLQQLSDCVPGPVRDVSRDPDPLFGSEGCGLATLSGVISDKAGPIIVDGQRQFRTWALAERQLASPGF